MLYLFKRHCLRISGRGGTWGSSDLAANYRALIPESHFRKSDSEWFTRGRSQFLRKSNGYYRNRRNAVGSLS